MERIKWSPRIRKELIKQLYDSDALGLQDDELCNQVGYRLYLRCQTIVMVSRDEVVCPRCGEVFIVNATGEEEAVTCPTMGCRWQTTVTEYRQSWSKKRIWGAKALPVFEEFYNRFTLKLPYQEKMFQIDQLIHRFHWSIRENLPNRSVADNLIEGNHDQVVAFLDDLAGLDQDRKAVWRETMHRMMGRRRGNP